jgi:colicin import membrane protein
MQQHERASSESYFWPVIWAVGLHVLIFAMLFVSFAFTPELPPSRPIIQATLYQLKSQSQATVQTSQRIAGESQKTAAPQYESEQMEQRKVEQQRQAAAKAAEQKKAEEARKAAEAQKQKEAAAAKAKADAEKKAAEQKRQAEIAMKKKAEEEAKKKAAAEAAKKKAAEELAKKKAAEEARKKAAAEEAKKKAAAEAAARARKAEEDKKAAALAELLADDVQHQQALADTVGDQVAGNLDDLIITLVSQQWRRPPSARQGMSVTVMIQMLPDGTITNASVTRSSGDVAFDNSAVAAVRNVGRIPEMQQLDRATFDRMYRKRAMIFKPEDLSL